MGKQKILIHDKERSGTAPIWKFSQPAIGVWSVVVKQQQIKNHICYDFWKLSYTAFCFDLKIFWPLCAMMKPQK